MEEDYRKGVKFEIISAISNIKSNRINLQTCIEVNETQKLSESIRLLLYNE